MRKMLSLLGLLGLLSLVLASCASTSITPAYLVRAKRDEGLLIAYQAHFAIDEDSITKISSHQYESLTLGDNTQYDVIQPEVFSFDIESAGNDPAEWKYKQNEYDKKSYDINSLVSDLKQMNVSYTGQIYVLITIFDDYKIIEASNLSNNTVLDSRYAIFKSNQMMPTPKNIDLSSLSRFHRRK